MHVIYDAILAFSTLFLPVFNKHIVHMLLIFEAVDDKVNDCILISFQGKEIKFTLVKVDTSL